MQQPEIVLNASKLQITYFNQYEPLGNYQGIANINFEEVLEKKECWICYDGDKKDALIEPCLCKGDMSTVHHECLKRWLIHNFPRTETPRCEICKSEYNLHRGNKMEWKDGFTTGELRTMTVVTAGICIILVLCWTSIYLNDNSYIQILSATVALLTIYMCFRCLGRNILHAYQRAKVAALNIGNKTTGNIDTNKTNSVLF